MSTIALAGGNGGFGKTLLDELEKTGKHRIYVLSRKAPSRPTAFKSEVIQIDYSDIHGLTDFLVANNVDTIVSSIYIMDEASCQAQLNLITAAVRTDGITKRFIASEYNMIMDEKTLGLNPTFQYLADNAESLRKSGLQWTRFANGYFMDYWGMPHIPTTLQEGTWAVDVANCTAAIPGTGDEVLSLTYSVDVAKAVTLILDVDEWSEYTLVVGEDISFNSLLSKAEQVRGRKFKVTYDSPELLRSGKCTMLGGGYSSGGTQWSEEELQEGTAWFGTVLLDGHLKMPTKGRMRDSFPGMQLTSVSQLLEKAWSGKA